MPTHRFQWHRDARIFAGADEVVPIGSAPAAAIPAHSVTAAIAGIYAAIRTDTPFCVSDLAVPDIDQIPPSHFATLTGGTSGAPKVILRTQASWIASFNANAAQFGYRPDDSIAVLGALSHSLALYGLLEGLHLGLSVHALSPLKPSGQSAQLHAHRCTILYATPTQLRLLPVGTRLHDIRLILCGGGTLGADTRHHITALCPNAELHVFYGAAETSFVTMGDSSTPEGSVGRPYAGVKIAVRDPDDTGTGVIWVRSPYLFERYLHGESAHTQRDGDWLTVGEYGHINAQGYLFLRGRAGRVINIADTAVFPEELEARFSVLAGISQCAVLARLDALRGRHLIAVLEGGEDAEKRNMLLRYCKANGLAGLRDVTFLDPFPLLASGKPDLRRIAALTGNTL